MTDTHTEPRTPRRDRGAMDRRCAPIRWIVARRNGIDILSCGHGLRPIIGRTWHSGDLRRRCWKCRMGAAVEWACLPKEPLNAEEARCG